MSNDEYERANRIFGSEMRALERLFGAINPDVIFSTPKKVARVIDLRQKYDIATNHRPWLRDKARHFECYDRETFDPDPESRWHIFGYGETSTEAVSELLANIAEEVAKG